MGHDLVTENGEEGLALKLLSTFHLNEEERKALPHGHINFSVAKAAVSEQLSENGWFPRPLNPDKIFGDWAIIEQSKDSIWLHQQFEIGVGCFSSVQSKKIRSLKKALRLYIKHYGGSPIDGIDIYG